MTRLPALLLAVLAAGPGRAFASIAKASLHVEPSAVKAGEPFLAAVKLALPPHWHVYWKNAGDSGLPPTLKWTLPEGFRAGPLQFAAPKLIRVGTLANYGYDHEAVFLVRIEPSSVDAPHVPLVVEAGWLVCQEECVPEKATLHLEVPTTPEEPHPGHDAALFAAARARLPRSASEAGFTASIGSQSAASAELRVTAPAGISLAGARAAFFPVEGDLLEHAAPQPQKLDGPQLTLTLPRSAIKPGALSRLEGVLVLEQAGSPEVALELTAAPAVAGAASIASATGAAAAASGSSPSLLVAIGFAFLGGLLLNLMPCVLPVLALKALGFARAAHGDPRSARRQALWFAFGVLASFWALAAVLLALRSGGAQLGWGFQLQSPRLVAGLALLFFALGLSFLGAVEIGTSLASAAGGAQLEQAQRGGAFGSFASGVLATAVATPCTAPFMGSALGFALVSPAPHAIAVFTALGAGMALPYLALSASPKFAKVVPKPGPWMEVLKQLLAFPLFATALWLLWVLSLQAGSDRVLAALAAMVLVGFGLWLLRTAGGPLAPTWRRRMATAAAVAIALFALLVGGGAGTSDAGSANPGATTASTAPEHRSRPGGLEWVDYSPERLAKLRTEGKPVYLDFTAAWCITCQVNKRVVFSSAEVVTDFARRGVTAMRADWTNRDDTISRALAEHGRSGVPLNLVYGGDGPPEVLPTVLTPSVVLEALQRHAVATRQQ